MQSKCLKTDLFSSTLQDIFLLSGLLHPCTYWIDDTTHFAPIVYHFNSRLLLTDHKIPPRGAGKVKTKEQNDAIIASTKEFKSVIWHGPARIPFDQPDPIGCWGNTTTGNIAKKFFGPEKCKHISAIYKFNKETDKEEFEKLLQAFNVILRVTCNSNQS